MKVIAFAQTAGIDINRHELSGVVEHFFEVRDLPASINGVSTKAASDVVIQSAFSHCFERVSGHVD